MDQVCVQEILPPEVPEPDSFGGLTIGRGIAPDIEFSRGSKSNL
jgi:hypothetical protein